MLILIIQLMLLVTQIILGIISFKTDRDEFFYLSLICCIIILGLTFINFGLIAS